MMKTLIKTTTALLFALFASMAIAADAPMEVAGATTIDTAKAKELFDAGTVFVDPRRDSDWAAGRIPDAVHLELKGVFNEASLTEATGGKDKAVIFYCNGAKCARSATCAEKAAAWGFSNIYYYRDGFPAWKAAGYPVE